MGFDAWFFARLDYEDKNKRMDEKALEFIWRPNSDTLGNDVQIFTHALYNHYSSPPGFNFDILDSDEPFISNAKSDTFNAKEKAQAMIDQVEERRDHYASNDIFMLFGDDFRYMDAF